MTASGRAVVMLVVLGAGLALAVDVSAQPDASATKLPWRWRWRRKPDSADAPSGSHLFHEGEDSLAYDQDVLQRIRTLHQRRFNDKEAYLGNATLATYLGLEPVRALHLPVPTSIVFIGFQGDGNMQVSISEQELASWFGVLDHVVPHTRIALSELTCSEDGHCAGQVEGTPPPSPLPSYVHLNFSCQVVSIAGHHVLETFDRALFAFSRPVYPDSQAQHGHQLLQQVDALEMESFVDSFLGTLGLDSATTLLVVNPRWSVQRAPYVYRAGFSAEEMTALSEQAATILELAARNMPPPPRPLLPPRQGGEEGPGGWMRRKHRKFEVALLAQQSMEWVKRAELYLKQLEEYQARIIRAFAPRVKAATAVVQALRLMHAQQRTRPHTADLATLLEATLRLPPEHLHNPMWGAAHPMTDCSTPLWVGHGRWLLIDLTAHRSDWGPALGGNGVVTGAALPDVSSAFAELSHARSDADAHAREAEDSSLSDTLHAMRTQRVAHVAAEAAAARSVHLGSTAAPGEVDPRVNPDGQHISGTSVEESERNAAEAMLAAELDVYEAFALRHCKGRRPAPTVCRAAAEAAVDVKHQLAAAAKESGSAHHQAFRSHRWDIFGSHVTAEEADPQAGLLATRLKDRFLAELGAVLSRGLRHVVAPPTATWHHQGRLHDTASPFAAKVHFSLYLISDTSRTLRHAHHTPNAAPGRPASFDLRRFSEQLQRLRVPGQTFSVSTRELNLLDEPALATSFSAAQRTTFVSVPHAQDDPVENEMMYLDSRELAWRLRRHYVDPSAARGAKRWTGDPHARMEVPVFVFLLDRDAPILLDEHYSARALHDLVVVVANAAHQDEHPAGFMCDGALLARPLSPLKHALAGVLQHLGGVLPPHLGYSPHSKAVVHDWLWSVGAHPLSWTSTGAAYSQVSIDALHRSYLLDGLDSSVEGVNAGIALLQGLAPSEEGHKALAKAQTPLRRVLMLYGQIVDVWRVAAEAAGVGNYGRTSVLLGNMEALTASFQAACKDVVAKLHPPRCESRHALPRSVIGGILGGSAAMGCAAVVLALLPRLQRKPKFN